MHRRFVPFARHASPFLGALALGAVVCGSLLHASAAQAPSASATAADVQAPSTAKPPAVEPPAAKPSAATAPTVDAGARPTALVGARLIDGTGRPPIDGAVVVIRGGKVEAVGPASQVQVPKEADVVTLTGKTLIPGLLSAHVHVSDVQGTQPRAYTWENTVRQLRLFARYGITTVWSLGGEEPPAYRARDTQNTPPLDRARIFLAGAIIEGATPEAARAMVQRVAATKPDFLKIRVDDRFRTSSKMSPAVYAAVIDEAHRLGQRVAVHIFSLEDAKGVLRAGADLIAHSVRDVEIDDEFITLMKARNVPYCPTLTREISTFVYESTPAFFTDPFFLREADPAVVAQLNEPARQAAVRQDGMALRYKAALPVALRNLKKAADAGLTIVMGTDAGASANRFSGYFEHVEMTMMQEAGLTPAQILRAATGEAARAMKAHGVGTITPGAWADLVVLDRDPLQDINNTRSLSAVWVAGRPLQIPLDSARP